MKKVYVIGHRNPDTDSICSSIAYAKLKQLMDVDAVAIRAGEINKETTSNKANELEHKKESKQVAGTFCEWSYF